MRLLTHSLTATLFGLLFYSSSVSSNELRHSYTLNIPPHTKHQALLELASQTQFEVIFDSGVELTGENSALEGRYTVFDALKILLKDTSLSYTVTNKQIRIHQLGSNTSVLPKVTVHGYLRDSSRIVLNDDTQASFPLYQVPLSIQSIPKSHMENVQARDVSDVLSMVHGVEFYEAFQGTRPFYYSRGIVTPFSIDGKFYRRTLVAPDPATLERIDFIQGPSANYLTAGGMLNFVTKKPTPENKQSWSFSAGPEDFYRSELDVNFANNGEVKQAFRLTGAYEKQAGAKRFASKEKRVFAPSYAVEFAGGTQLLASGYSLTREQFVNTTTIHDSTLGYRLPEDRTLAFPWENSETQDSTAAIDFINPDVNGWRISLGGNWTYSNTDNNFTALIFPFSPNDPSDFSEEIRLPTYFYDEGDYTKSHGVDGSVEKSVNVGNTDALLRFGMDYQWFDYVDNSYSPFIPILVDIRNPDYTIPPFPTPEQIGRETQITYFRSVYTSQQWYLSKRLSVMFDLRYEDMKFVRDRNQFDLGEPQATESALGRYKEWTPQLGINIEHSSTFASHFAYSESFSHQNIIDVSSVEGNSGKFVPPNRTEQVEFSLKKSIRDNRLNGSLTFYYITVSDLTFGETDIIPVTDNYYAEEQRSKGGSFSLEGELTQNLSVITNINYNDNTVPLVNLETAFNAVNTNTPISEKRQLHGTAKKNGNIWLHYDTDSGRFKNIDFGVGAKYVGDRYGDDANTFTLEEYSTTDVLFRYTGLDNIDLSISVRNIFDKFHYRSSLGFSSVVEEGERRSVYCTLQWKNFFND